VDSSSGVELDHGELLYEIPMVVDESIWDSSFSATPGQDRIVFSAQAGGGIAFGDWEVVGPAPVPISSITSVAMALALAAVGYALLPRSARSSIIPDSGQS
jgi:hypothetical protein